MRLVTRIGRYRRTVAAGICSIVLCGAALATAPEGGASPAAPAAGGFSNGTAKATALVAKVAPGVGSLQLALGDRHRRVARSERPRPGPGPGARPRPHRHDADRRGLRRRRGVGHARPAPPAPAHRQPRGRRHRPARTSSPSAGATVRRRSQGGPGHRAARCARATATASSRRLRPGHRRSTAAEPTPPPRSSTARPARPTPPRRPASTSPASCSCAGCGGTRCTARAPTRRRRARSRSRGAAAAGVPVPIEDLGAAEDAINQVLAPSGITRAPAEDRALQAAGRPRAGHAAAHHPQGLPRRQHRARPGARPHARAARASCSTQLAAAVLPDLAGALLVGDIGVSIASGTGFLAIEVGGAEATTGELVLDDPFGSARRTRSLSAAVLPASGVGPAGHRRARCRGSAPGRRGAAAATTARSSPSPTSVRSRRCARACTRSSWPLVLARRRDAARALGLAATAGVARPRLAPPTPPGARSPA